MFRIGITGGIGCGKTTVCKLMEERGIPVFYADTEAHVLLNEDPDVRQRVTTLLGKSAYVDGTLDRKAVGKVVFNDKEKLDGLNAIMRPAVRKRFDRWCLNQSSPYALMESAILIESGGHLAMDHIVVVTAPREVRLERAMKRDGANRDQIEARMAAQMSEDELLENAHSIIVNSGALDALRPQVKELYTYLDEVVGSQG